MKQTVANRNFSFLLIALLLYSCNADTSGYGSHSSERDEKIHADSVPIKDSAIKDLEEVRETSQLTNENLMGIWLNDNPWKGKGTERYKDYEELDFRSDRTVYQDGRLIGSGWTLTTDKEGDSVIEYISPRRRRSTQLVILSSTAKTLKYGFKSGNGEYSLTKKQ